ncbi:alpha/beta hydrolase family protein [Intrasporangium calvum]|uniref:Phospholipase/Carboxylesterase n=1 Tax=Intrasporangium calvum (strain ATCC 23552 / DSM 43043 / JCM 3097 / NBRC 12989 / NCIMB 10167 / NRRL B-3866 / 7 KIP) TaxID=710696 RepID=E6S6M4_INTC7|nr:alpha/beta fold hydrolase [Intrasporangium calvum]ADU50041.1 phospholipase/Carboxylesterase [Intrasporangium calvum DSM 43043]
MRTAFVAGSLAAVLAAGACTSSGSPPRAPTLIPTAPAETQRSSTSPSPVAPPSASASPPASPTAGPTGDGRERSDPAFIDALFETDFDGRDLRLGREGGSTDAYRQYFVTYRGDGLRISGRINIPRGSGPFPAVVLAHGYVPLEQYTNGATMLRERDHLARKGYVTLHIDYRNHAQSDDDPDNGPNLRIGYTVDAVNAGLALQQLDAVDPDRIGIIGRSMGGGVVYGALVAVPGLFKAGVAYSPVSSDTVDNFNRWVRRDRDRGGDARAVLRRLGAPERAPRTWARTSPRTYFDRITDPILIHHGTDDEDCPIRWSEETVTALKQAGKKVTYHVYSGERHTFTSQWPLSIRRTEAFLDTNLR